MAMLSNELLSGISESGWQGLVERDDGQEAEPEQPVVIIRSNIAVL